MCLPIGCLKGIVCVGATLSVLISVGLLALTIYANVQKKQIIDRASQGLVNHALIGMYIGSIVFFLLGTAGLYGSIKGIQKKKKTTQGTCLLTFYSIGIFVFFVAFVGGAIFFFIGPQTIFGLDCKAGSKLSLISDLYNTTLVADSQFCSENCPCLINNDTSDLYTQLKDKGLNPTTDPRIGQKRYQDCSTFNQSLSSQSLTLATLEQLLVCGGWCPGDMKYYRFTNLTSCITQQCMDSLDNCYKTFETFMKDKGILLALGCIGAAVISLINILAVCCICCHPSSKNKSKNFYSRMLDDN